MIGKFASTPEFNVHRDDVAAVDASTPDVKSKGVNAKGYRWAVVDLILKSGSLTALGVSVFMWSEAAGKFVKCAGSEFTQSGLTEDTQFVCQVMGRTFWVGIDTLTGTSPVITISVAGYGEPSAH